MGYQENGDFSPLQGINVSFQDYVERKKQQNSVHMDGLVPDYAFASDYEVRKKLSAIPGFESLGRKLISTRINMHIKNILRQGAIVNERQFPDIYRMGVDCARTLGISIPQIVIVNNPNVNAYTISNDSDDPLVVLYSGLVERFRDKPGCTKSIIGHECGHIHNNHILYGQIVNYIFTMGQGGMNAHQGFAPAMGFMPIFTGANMLLISLWNRAQEVTADRAGMICADDPEDAIRADMLLLSGGMFNVEAEMDIETLEKQYEEIINTPVSYMEALDAHPATVRRIFCGREFKQCELLYRWRPELKNQAGPLHTKEETDERCKKLVSIRSQKEGGRANVHG